MGVRRLCASEFVASRAAARAAGLRARGCARCRAYTLDHSDTDLRSAGARYAEDGYVIMRGVLDADLVAEMSDHVAWIARKVSRAIASGSMPAAAPVALAVPARSKPWGAQERRQDQ